VQWPQDAHRNNIHNPSDVRREASKHFRKKKKEFLKVKLVKLKLTERSRISETYIGE